MGHIRRTLQLSGEAYNPIMLKSCFCRPAALNIKTQRSAFMFQMCFAYRGEITGDLSFRVSWRDSGDTDSATVDHAYSFVNDDQWVGIDLLANQNQKGFSMKGVIYIKWSETHSRYYVYAGQWLLCWFVKDIHEICKKKNNEEKIIHK